MIFIYIYSPSSNQPIGVIMKNEYRLEVFENCDDAKYFIVNIETNNIDLLNELNLLFKNFAKRKRNY